MKITGTIAKVYDIQEGEYIGVPYKNMDVVINLEKEENRPAERVAIRFKGKHLDDFLSSGFINDRMSHTYDLIMDVAERDWKDGKKHPENKMPVCVSFA